MDHIEIALEADCYAALASLLARELGQYPKTLANRGEKLRAQSLSLTLDGEDLTASVQDQKGTHRIRMTLPIFDASGGYSLTQCSCLEGRLSLDETRCAHMWIVHKKLLERLEHLQKLAAPVVSGVTTLPERLQLLGQEISLAAETVVPSVWRVEVDQRDRLHVVEVSAGGRQTIPWLNFVTRVTAWEERPQQKWVARFLYAQELKDADWFGLWRDLVGERSVFLRESGEAVSVVHGQIYIKVLLSQKEARIDLVVDGNADAVWREFPGRGFVVRSGTTFHVLALPPAVCAVVHALRSGERVWPLSQRAALWEALRNLESFLPVILVGEHVQQRLAENRPLTLRLEPWEGEVVQIRMLSRPTLAGPGFPAGHGPSSILDALAAEPVQVQRDLAWEKNAAQDLQRRLGLRADEGGAPSTWYVRGRERLLDVLTALSDLPAHAAVVDWPRERPTHLTVREEPEPGSLQVSVRRKNNWFMASGALRLGETSIGLKELLAAIADGKRFVSLRDGSWLPVTEPLREKLLGLADQNLACEDGVRLSPSNAEALDTLLATPLVGAREVESDWQSLCSRWKELEEAQPPALENFHATLRPYQQEGYRWLWRRSQLGLGAILADDMGLGKTVQTLALLKSRAELGPVLLIAPTSLLYNWRQEAARFAPDLKMYFLADGDRQETVRRAGPGDVVLCSYGLSYREAARLSARHWSTLVLDEAHAVKNADSLTSCAVRSLSADWVLALTGTPMENRLSEMWSLMQVVVPDFLPPWSEFQEAFVKPIEENQAVEPLQRLRRMIQPFMLRRLKQDHLHELPAKTEIDIFIPLATEERTLYEAQRQEALRQLAEKSAADDGRAAFSVLAELTRLRRQCCDPRLILPDWHYPSSKTEKFLEIAHRLKEAGHRALVFSQFTGYLKLLSEALNQEGISHLYLDGGTSARQRALLVKQFQEGDAHLFLVSLKAGGTGLNLTAADYVLHLDPWWNPKIEDQATDRAHRMGQQNPVTVYRFITRHTVEERIVALHRDKRALIGSLLDADDAEFSAQQDWTSMLQEALGAFGEDASME